MTIGAPLDFDDLLSSLTDESAFIFWLSASSETRDDDDGTKQAKIAENRAMVLEKKNSFLLDNTQICGSSKKGTAAQNNICDEFC